MFLHPAFAAPATKPKPYRFRLMRFVRSRTTFIHPAWARKQR